MQERFSDDVIHWPESFAFWFVNVVLVAAPVGLGILFDIPKNPG